MAEGLKRGDVVVVAIAGEFGKPRPAVVVQCDSVLRRSDSVVLCPLTSDVRDAYHIRADLSPSGRNGLQHRSQVMLDKITTVGVRRIGARIGELSDTEMREVDRRLVFVLGLAD